jgi:hypothetical protein
MKSEQDIKRAAEALIVFAHRLKETFPDSDADAVHRITAQAMVALGMSDILQWVLHPDSDEKLARFMNMLLRDYTTDTTEVH